MALPSRLLLSCSTLCLLEKRTPFTALNSHTTRISFSHSSSKTTTSLALATAKKVRSHVQIVARAQKPSSSSSSGDDIEDDDDSPYLMNKEEREEMRRKIREMLDNVEDPPEETDPERRKIKMQKLVADYPLVVEEEDPDWPEDADGWGFKFDQFFDKITIKNVRNEGDDEDYDSDKEIVWQDDNYIKPIRDVTAKEWEDTVFKDFNPLVILVHNRYKRSLQSPC